MPRRNRELGASVVPEGSWEALSVFGCVVKAKLGVCNVSCSGLSGFALGLTSLYGGVNPRVQGLYGVNVYENKCFYSRTIRCFRLYRSL